MAVHDDPISWDTGLQQNIYNYSCISSITGTARNQNSWGKPGHESCETIPTWGLWLDNLVYDPTKWVYFIISLGLLYHICFFTILIYHINLGWLMIGCISLYHLHLRTRCLVPRYLWNPLRNFKKKQRTHIDTNNGIMMNFKQEQRRCIVCIVLQVDAPCLPGFVVEILCMYVYIHCIL